VTARTGTARPLLGRRVARFNRCFTNRLTRPLARWLPGFGVVIHAGRKSHRRYSTPVNLFSDADGYVIALTYGTQSDWVKNVLASGSCELITGGRCYELTAEIRHDEQQRLVPRLVRVPLRLLRVTDFMHLSRRLREEEQRWPSD
jgi:deazaflavin-dependent oxidoreductase (nitroreductase family)